MSKKIDVDSCDTLSDHAKQAVIIYPDMKKLHFTSIFSADVIQFLKEENRSIDGKRPMIIVTPTVSSCFDVALLAEKILGANNVQSVYPHTVAKYSTYDRNVIVAPACALQLTTPLNDLFASASNVVLLASEGESKFMVSILKPHLAQMSDNCKLLILEQLQDLVEEEIVVALKPMAEEPQQLNIQVSVEPEVEVESELSIIVEPADESDMQMVEVQLEAEPEIEMMVEPEVNISETSDDNEQTASNSESEQVHHIVMVDRNYKRSYLRNRLKGSDKKTLVITRTRHNAHRLEEYLYQGKVRSRILHANLSDEAKDKVIERFVSGELSVLLLPEAVAQAVDLPDVNEIIFFDLPDVGVEFKERITVIGERFNVHNTSSIVTLDETPWVEAMEEELKWTLPKVQAAPPQRSHNILRIKNRTNNKDKAEKTEKRTGRGLRKLGGKNNQQKKRTNQFPTKQSHTQKDNFNDHSNANANYAEDPFNSVNQSIVNENRNPFAFDSFEASVSRQNKKRVKQLFSRKEAPQKEVQSDFNVQKSDKKNVKIVHRKKRTFDVNGNQ